MRLQAIALELLGHAVGDDGLVAGLLPCRARDGLRQPGYIRRVVAYEPERLFRKLAFPLHRTLQQTVGGLRAKIRAQGHRGVDGDGAGLPDKVDTVVALLLDRGGRQRDRWMTWVAAVRVRPVPAAFGPRISMSKPPSALRCRWNRFTICCLRGMGLSPLITSIFSRPKRWRTSPAKWNCMSRCSIKTSTRSPASLMRCRMSMSALRRVLWAMNASGGAALVAPGWT